MQIGPGRLVLVVGPSGSGKDTLIAAVRQQVGTDVVFPRRVVTRPASAHEDHDSLSEEDFLRAAGQGAFALTWHAHGLRYGVPASIDADLCAARTVVCNVSRAIVPAARAKYVLVTVVLITAPADVLISRLSARRRPSDGALAGRLARPAATIAPDVVIENVGSTRAGAARLAAVIRDGWPDLT